MKGVYALSLSLQSKFILSTYPLNSLVAKPGMPEPALCSESKAQLTAQLFLLEYSTITWFPSTAFTVTALLDIFPSTLLYLTHSQLACSTGFKPELLNCID